MDSDMTWRRFPQLKGPCIKEGYKLYIIIYVYNIMLQPAKYERKASELIFMHNKN